MTRMLRKVGATHGKRKGGGKAQLGRESGVRGQCAGCDSWALLHGGLCEACSGGAKDGTR